MFPADAKTEGYELNGTSNITFATSTKTILGISIQQGNVSSNSWIECNGSVIAKNYQRDLVYNPLNYVCNGVFALSKTGQDTAFFIITYVERDIRNSQPISASSSQFFLNGFSYGEITSTILLIMIFTGIFFAIIKNWVFGTKIDGQVRVISEKSSRI